MRRILPPTLVVAIALATLTAHLVLQPPTIGIGLRSAGGPVAAAALAMSIWGSRRFARAGTNINTFDSPDLLVSDGLFRWSRNPMYVGFVVALGGVGLAIGSLVGLAAPLAFFVAADRWYIPFEESEMRQAFGVRYHDYCRRVRRWITWPTAPTHRQAGGNP